jgi:hypothetical protein
MEDFHRQLAADCWTAANGRSPLNAGHLNSQLKIHYGTVSNSLQETAQ